MLKATKGFLASAALAGLGLGVWALLARYREAHAPRAILLTPSVQGVDPAYALGLGRLVRDEWEVSSASTILVPGPGAPLPQGLSARDVLVRLSGKIQDGLLSLRVEWAGPEELNAGSPWEAEETPFLPPAEAVFHLRNAGPFRVFHPDGDHLFPEDAARFWRLAASASVDEDVAANAGLKASRELVAVEPRSAAAWVNYGEHIYRNLWTQPAEGDMPQAEALAAFDRALALVPGYPRAALLKGMLLTDVGNQREALRALVEARTMRPQLTDVYDGLAYAGRTGGLLEGALRALAVRERLTRPFQGLASPWFAENTYLYAGEWDAFRANLGESRDPLFLFYRGYLELAMGRAQDALPYFKEGALNRQTSIPFSDLCGVYAAAIQGQGGDAFARLQAFEADRGRLRIPDGELTFKVAEAYAFLGRPEEAIAAAGRAFAQGFGCLQWYERSPLFASARQSPKWAALRQHVADRQSLLEQSFPPGTFG